MNIKVVPIEKNKHFSQFKCLFEEYASDLNEEIRTASINHLFELPYFQGFICFVDDQPAACAVCYESFSTYRAMKMLNIHDFMVSERFRGKGLGKDLLQGIEMHCFERGFLKITLEVSETNEVAQKLYHSCGFQDYQVEQQGSLHWQKYLG